MTSDLCNLEKSIESFDAYSRRLICRLGLIAIVTYRFPYFVRISFLNEIQMHDAFKQSRLAAWLIKLSSWLKEPKDRAETINNRHWLTHTQIAAKCSHKPNTQLRWYHLLTKWTYAWQHRTQNTDVFQTKFRHHRN